jgi:hypothetical protein
MNYLLFVVDMRIQKGHVVTNMPYIFLLFYILLTTQSGNFASATAKSMLKYL